MRKNDATTRRKYMSSNTTRKKSVGIETMKNKNRTTRQLPAQSTYSRIFSCQLIQLFFFGTFIGMTIVAYYLHNKFYLDAMFSGGSFDDQPKAEDAFKNAVASTKDSTSKNFFFSRMWYRGTKFRSFEKLVPKAKEEGKPPMKVDILSVGSNLRKDLLTGQVKSWASHKSVRYFFGLTESDDADPNCYKTLTKRDMKDASSYCSNENVRNLVWKNNTLMKTILGEYFAKGEYLDKLEPEWLCEQKRISHGIGKLGRFYQHNHQKNQGSSNSGAVDVQSLPDYLIIVNDDTQYNMDWFTEYVASLYKHREDAAWVEAGCLVRFALQSLNFNFPFGGYGLILNKNAIENLFIRRIHLHKDPAAPISHKERNCLNYKDDFLQNACRRLKENLVGESTSFVNGMTVSDLIDAHASRDRYSDSNWRVFGKKAIKTQKHKPYCLHSDWVTGYYINNYQVSNHVADLNPRKEKKGWIAHHDTRIGSELGYLEYKSGEIDGQGNGNCLNYNSEICDKKSPRPNVCRNTQIRKFAKRKNAVTTSTKFVKQNIANQKESIGNKDKSIIGAKRAWEAWTKSTKFVEQNIRKRKEIIGNKDKSKAVINKVLLPSLQIIGAKRAATTSTAQYLTQYGGYIQPKLFNGEPAYYDKQVHFFNEKERYKQGYNFYAQRWNHSSNFQDSTASRIGNSIADQLVQGVDATPDTFFHPKKVWKTYKAQNVTKELKIIFIARNPVSRELSWYSHLFKNSLKILHNKRTFDNEIKKLKEKKCGVNVLECRLTASDLNAIILSHFILSYDQNAGYYPASFDEYISNVIHTDKNGTLVWQDNEYSWYAKYLKEWFYYFDRKQILILNYFELQQNPKRFMKRIGRFLNNKKLYNAANSGDGLKGESKNEQKLSQIGSKTSRKKLHRIFDPLNDELDKLLKTMGPGPLAEQNPLPNLNYFNFN